MKSFQKHGNEGEKHLAVKKVDNPVIIRSKYITFPDLCIGRIRDRDVDALALRTAIETNKLVPQRICKATQRPLCRGVARVPNEGDHCGARGNEDDATVPTLARREKKNVK